MRDQQREVAFNLRKAEEYRKKAEAATEPRMRAAFNAVVREYLERARLHALPRNGETNRAGSRQGGGCGGGQAGGIEPG
jgi:hypothetical protein